ncbi:MAG: hypothetical protein FJW39_25885 [Acidobacteria bacterium]|nr:hypothetical protein [Acidobacteriota bacterium]
MVVPRAGHTPTLLQDGSVLFTGGLAHDGPTATAEIYNAELRRFVRVPDMSIARERHAATLLDDGRVLIVGGTVVRPSVTAEVFDPGRISSPVPGGCS